MTYLTSSPLVWAPSAAAGVNITPSGSSWGNSAWVELITSTATAIQIEELSVDPAVAAEFEIDVGIGRAGSEISLGTVIGYAATAASGVNGIVRFPLVVDNVPASSRISYRLRKNGTNTSVWTAAIGYYANLTDSNDLTNKAQTPVPSAAVGITITPGAGAWLNGAWGQLTTGVSSAIWIASIAFVPSAAIIEFEIDIGTGGSGSEVVATTIRGISDNTAARGIINCALPHGLSVAANTRLAARTRNHAGDTGTWGMKIAYYDQEASAEDAEQMEMRLLISQP